jgi:methylglutaconyl-CoA hydratase
MADSNLLLSVDAAGTAEVALNRPALHNAFDDQLIAELTAALERVGQDPAVRRVVLAARGKSFSAGADLNWMKRVAAQSFADNLRDAEALARMLAVLDRLPKPTLALVQGPAFGGGVGLIAACDYAIAAEQSSFALSEVRVGLIPATISPYVVAAIGARASRRYMLTGERFDAAEALRIGLVHAVVPGAELAAAAARALQEIAAGAPEAQAVAKTMIASVQGRPREQALAAETARLIAERRASAEGREGLAAFLEKRTPAWRKT